MTGVILIAFGRRGYGLMARNLALSLRHYAPDLPIICYAPKELHGIIGRENITQLLTLGKEYYTNARGKIDPCKAKCHIYELGIKAGMDKMLYLDVDALALADITPMINALNGTPFNCEIVGKGKVGDRINYLIWASQKDTIEQFNVKRENPTLYATQTSWAYFERSKVAKAMQAQLKWHHIKGFPKHLLTHQWGGAIPDELMYTGVLAKLGLDLKPLNTERHPIFFGNKNNRKSVDAVVNGYYLLSLYGNGGSRSLTVGTWKRLYDTHVKKMGSKYLSHELLSDKFVNA